MSRATIFGMIGVIVVAIALIACSSRKGPSVGAVNGKVTNVAGEPLAGAQILVAWDAEVDVFADSQQARIRMCKTLSAQDGSFHVDSWQAPRSTIGSVRATSYAYLTGYNTRPVDKPAEHFDASPAVHVLRAVESDELAASDDLIFASTTDCAKEAEFAH